MSRADRGASERASRSRSPRRASQSRSTRWSSDAELDDTSIRTCARSASKRVRSLATSSDIARHEALLDEAEAAIGPLTTLVNNAGVSVLSRGDLLDVTPESYDRCQAVNARGLFFLTQDLGEAYPFAPRARGAAPLDHHALLVQRGRGLDHRGEYCASKAAAAMIAKLFAVRLGAEGIGSYEIRPGLIETPMTAPSAGPVPKANCRGAHGRPAHGPAFRYRGDGGRARDRAARLLHGSGPAGRRRPRHSAFLTGGATEHVPCPVACPTKPVAPERYTMRAAPIEIPARAASVQSRRVLRRSCRRRSFRRQGALARPRNRLAEDAWLPASAPRSGSRHRRGDGHGAAWRRPRLGRRA